MTELRRRLVAFLTASAVLAPLMAAAASPSLVVDVDSGDVLYQSMATNPWYPASTTKLMTVYVALAAVKEGRITLDTPLMVSPRAASMAPSKMGFRPGTLVTLDNALKMLMVKSPNDIAVTIAEGVSGSVENFANEMNVYATRLGLRESHFVNPNGLPDARHVSSARDMAMIGRGLLRDFPQERGLFSIGVLAFGGRLINNHNGLLGRYPGVDGMKTGFTCAAGYNVVASAERNGRHLIAVVMGAPSTAERNMRTAALFDRFFATAPASFGPIESLPSSGSVEPPDNRAVACGRGRAAAVAEAATDDAQIGVGESGLSPTRIAFEPVRVFVGPVPGWTGRVAQAIGTGAREYVAAPVKPTAYEQRNQVAVAAVPAGPVEAAAPVPGGGPLALVGATPLPPAEAAARSLVRAAPGLGLKAAARRRAARHHIAPVTATLARPSLLATGDGPEEAPAPTAANKAKPKAAPASKAAAVKAGAKAAPVKPPAKAAAVKAPPGKPAPAGKKPKTAANP